MDTMFLSHRKWRLHLQINYIADSCHVMAPERRPNCEAQRREIGWLVFRVQKACGHGRSNLVDCGIYCLRQCSVITECEHIHTSYL